MTRPTVLFWFSVWLASVTCLGAGLIWWQSGLAEPARAEEPQPRRKPGVVRVADVEEQKKPVEPLPLDRTPPTDLPVVPYPVPDALAGIDLSRQTQEQADAKSFGCIECHKGSVDPHMTPTVRLGCVDCHCGDPSATEKELAHVPPHFPQFWPSSGNPVRTYTLLNRENPQYIQFVNPGDLRIAHLSCGTANCHEKQTLQVRKSMMTHGCMLWGAALYNNGSVPFKRAKYGESYSMHGVPQRMITVPPPTEYEMERKGVVPFLDPMPRFQITQPGNVLRTFERGGRFQLEVGIPETKEEPGRPRARLSVRGLGTANRTDPVFIGLQKTRLLDPTLNFLGTNDHPGDYRSSGCTACHVVYANDRSPIHSGAYAMFGNLGQAATQKLVEESEKKFKLGLPPADPCIPKDESGHPIAHKFTRSVPTSQCIVCHIHPGTTVMNSYLGYTWWDEETEGSHMYPRHEKELTSEEVTQAQMLNPDEAAARGNWSEPEFLNDLTDLNRSLRKTQFADFHGHGWVYRAVFKKDREGHLLDHEGEKIQGTPDLVTAVRLPQRSQDVARMEAAARNHPEDVELRKRVQKAARLLEGTRVNAPVHLMDIHLERGMHCVDCHFVQDVHGDTKLYMETRAAIEIGCIDCHGTADAYSSLRTTGPAARETSPGVTVGRNLAALRTPFGKPRFERRGDEVIQNSMMERNLNWKVRQTKDTVDPQSIDFNARSALAKRVWMSPAGEIIVDRPPPDSEQCAHANERMNCIACHSSWNPSCYGCHLPQKANRKMPDLHNEGDVTRNYVSYNFQTLRDEVFMLAKDGDVTGNKVGPSRSSCAIHVGSYNQNRESIYVQQQTVSAEGLSGIAFSTNVPHTVRGLNETKNCTDCHVSRQNDNNALMAQLLMQGTNYLNFMGRYCWVACGEEGFFAVEVTERDEPQTVIGSTMHRKAYPKRHEDFVLQKHRKLEHGHEHPGVDVVKELFNPFHKPEILNVQARGEFLYAACGKDGVRVFDIAFIDHKGFSERIVTAPVSAVGQRLFVKTCDAAWVAAPTTVAPDPTRTHQPENKEQSVHALYGYILVADRAEGLILISAATLLDGNPDNNFLKKDVAFNPDGLLSGAKFVTTVGNYAYVCCDVGLVVICLDEPTQPYVTATLDHEAVEDPHCVQVQFRYGFVCDHHGLKILDCTDPSQPRKVSELKIEEAHSVYVARTYAYVAGGKEGLIIVDVKNPEQPRIDQIFTAHGELKDVHDVKLAITYVSEFAYIADGEHGLKVVQLTSPETPGNDGFSPRPTPHLVSTFELPKGGHVLNVSEALDRDRAVDESGNQLSVFGRVGARPFNQLEQRKMYQRPDGTVWRVVDGQRTFQGQTPSAREAALWEQLKRDYQQMNLEWRSTLPEVQPQTVR